MGVQTRYVAEFSRTCKAPGFITGAYPSALAGQPTLFQPYTFCLLPSFRASMSFGSQIHTSSEIAIIMLQMFGKPETRDDELNISHSLAR
jgi:hypothetical protein